MILDMSAEAVTERLRLVSQLRRLCLALGKAESSAREPATARPPAGVELDQATAQSEQKHLSTK